jgi:large subunit ribosomal protein L21
VYAIIHSGGRQVRVEPGAVVTVDLLTNQAGDPVTFGQVLFIEQDGGGFVSGSPFVAGATVTGVVDAQVQGPKIRVFKRKRRKAMRRTIGHRSKLTRVRITGIETG